MGRKLKEQKQRKCIILTMNFSISLSFYKYIPLNSLAATHHTNMVKVLLLTVACEYAPTNIHTHIKDTGNSVSGNILKIINFK